MIIKQAKVFGADHHFHMQDIRIEDGRIAGTSESIAAGGGEEVIPANGMYALPALVDIHQHGAVGYDYCDASEEALSVIAEYEAQNGVLAVCATTMTISENDLLSVAKVVSNHKNSAGADIVGINLEGPFVSPDRLGAQNPLHQMNPDVNMIRRIQKKSGGKVKLLDLAPELDGAIEAISELRKEMTISVAHTSCDYETAIRAYKAGASHLTHTFNAMNPMLHRSPGPIPAAVESGANAELICDGIHIHPAMVRLVFSLFKGRMILISDSMRACGLSDGTYDLGGQEVRINGRRAELARDSGVLAGSVTNLYECMKTAVNDMGIPIEEAVLAATENPARAIGIDDEYGSIAPGRYANIVLCDENLDLIKVYRRGEDITK